MDAKAKVVAVVTGEYRQLGTVPHLIVACVDRLADGTELIPLTDHEAALAELSERIEELQTLCNHLIAEKANAIAANATLLTGLEALAGEREELAAWRELSLASSMPGSNVWPNLWPQDVAAVAYLIWTLQSNLSDLYALAVEWDSRVSPISLDHQIVMSACAEELRERIHTLTNSAKGDA